MELLGIGVLLALAAAAGGTSVMRNRARRTLQRSLETAHAALIEKCPADGWKVTEAADLVLLSKAEQLLALVGEPGDGIDNRLASLMAADPTVGPVTIGSIVSRKTVAGYETALVAWRDGEFQPFVALGLPTDARVDRFVADRLGNATHVDETLADEVVDYAKLGLDALDAPCRIGIIGKHVLIYRQGLLTPKSLSESHAIAQRIHEMLPRMGGRM